MRAVLQPAYILHSRPYRDTSLLLEAFTAQDGRLSLVSRGARRRARGGSGSALLQPFTPLLLTFGGRSEMKTLTAVEAAGAPLRLSGDRLFSGLYLNELLVRLLHRNDPHPGLFAAYGTALAEVSSSEAVETALRRFEFTLLDQLGYSFDLTTEGDTGEAVRAGQWYHYRSDCGLVAGGDRGERSSIAFAGEDLLRMAAGEFGGSARQAAKRLLRLALADHLGGVPLRSRDLFSRHSAPGAGKRIAE
jgi:DNA repair protein RecO (recombination protein O)